MSNWGWNRACAVIGAIMVASLAVTGCESVGIEGELDGSTVDGNTGVDGITSADATVDGAPLTDGISPGDTSPDGEEPDVTIPDGQGPDADPGVCGDGIVEDHEACDDGNAATGDGCDLNCELEPGWYCDETGCACEAGHFGPACTPCGDCGVYGACNEGLDGDGSCGCEIGYAGEDCRVCDVGYAPVDGGPWTDGGWCMPNDECAETQCSDNGLCVYPDGGPLVCECYDGWEGDDCSANTDECADESLCGPGACVDQEPSALAPECLMEQVDEEGTPVAGCAASEACETAVCEQDAFCCDEEWDLVCGELAWSTPDCNVPGYMCECPEGWVGMHCEENVDECAGDESLCQNGGECVDTDGAYECVCPDGWIGDHCETNVDECAADTSPCQNGGECVDTDGAYECLCEPGWQGANCGENIDECATDEVLCLNGGECVDTDGAYECLCEPGWQGMHCEENVDECAFDVSPCENDGECVDSDGTYECLCTEGWQGPHCEENVDECAFDVSPCDNGGECVDTDGAYECVCPDEWQGTNCQENVDECGFDPPICANESECVDHVPFDHALCQGPSCESDVCMAAVQALDDWCGADPDGDGVPSWDSSCAQCAAGGVTFYADCTEIGDACDNPAGYSCECADGWTGLNCEEDIDECAFEQPICWNDGECFNSDGGFECACGEGFVGTFCEDDVDECEEGLDDCSEDAACLNDYGSYGCECNDGFEGDGVTCEDVDECQPVVEAVESFDEGELPENWTVTDNDIEDDVSWFVSAGEAESGVLRYSNAEGTSHGDDIATSGSVHTGPTVLPQEAMFYAQVALDLGDNGSQSYDTFEIYIKTCPEEMEWDVCEVEDAAELTEVWNKAAYYEAIDQGFIEAEGDWLQIQLDLTAWSGETAAMVFAFDTIDELVNEGTGIWIDDLKLTGPSLDTCSEQAICENSAGSYDCTCLTGWAGDGFNCENIDECADPASCGPNSTCEDSDGSYTCGCEDGFIEDPGLEVGCMDLDECAESVDDCGAYSACTNEVGGYSCACDEGYFSEDGKDCENVDDRAEADLNTCDASANCVDQETQPCANSQSCPLEDCVAAVGVLDPWCLTNWDGLCANCAAGEIGAGNVDCTEIAEAGVCLGAPYACTCDDGFLLDDSGTSCSDIDECLDAPCQNGGECDNLDGGYSCACPDGWFGQDCEFDVDECEGEPCQNGGICENAEGDYLCDCPLGWAGKNCEEDVNECLEFAPCQNGGACNNSDGDYSCTCPMGWTGKDCEVDVDECLDSPCINGGECQNAMGGYVCDCPDAWAGQDCQDDVNECVEFAPCQNGGACNNWEGSYSCTCPTGWTGKDCDEDVDECLNSPCLNGGECLNAMGDYVCECPDGWTGKDCQTDIDECLTVDCNNGVCENSLGSYACVCDSGWEGAACDQDVDECLTANCNNGVCENSLGSYACVCDSGWEGAACDQNIDDCVPGVCNVGVCVDQVNGYVCDCPDNAQGDNCEMVDLLFEDFTSGTEGWSTTGDWAIGPTSYVLCTDGSIPSTDPETDHSSDDSNHVAGTVLGGCVSTYTTHDGFEYLTSPAVNANGYGQVTLEFWRWIGTDYPDYQYQHIQVYDGASWVTIWEKPSDGQQIVDTEWTLITYDITAYANANLQVRWGNNINSSGVWLTSGWNVDDVRIHAD